MNQFRSTVILFAGSLLVFGGCHTYGRHGTVEANNEALVEAVNAFASEAVRASTDYRILAGIAAIEPNLLAAFGDAAIAHGSEAERLLDALAVAGPMSYRDSSRLLSSVVTTRRTYHNRYQSLLSAMAGHRPELDPDRSARYHAVPASWYRDATPTLTVGDVEAAIRTARANPEDRP